jgi:uncharacterized protein (DUF1810 family)
MTLFGAVSRDPDFLQAIAKYYDGLQDQRTLDLLTSSRRP